MIKIIKKIYNLYRWRKITNIFNTNYKKKALLSYITHPFRENSQRHTNYYEAVVVAEILNRLGYIVDVVYYDNDIQTPLSQYEVIFGFGVPFKKYFDSGLTQARTIYYGTGVHVCDQNSATLRRVRDVFLKKGKWLKRSARFVEGSYGYYCAMADGIIALGNDECQKSYKKYCSTVQLYGINAPFFNTQDGFSIHKNRNIEKTKKSFLWFGSSGLIHKGLDLCLDFFSLHPELSLHICGDISSEKDFIKAYRSEIFQSKNIYTHGFVDINSNQFYEILSSCCFVIFPSCSEGGAPSVITAIGNGALIPIISKNSCISTGAEIWIEELSVRGVEEAIKITLKMSSTEIIDNQIKNLLYVINNHNQELYFNEMESAISEIIKSQ